MTPESKIRFAIENPRSAAEFIARVPHKARLKGEAYHEEDAVFELHETTPRTAYRARVRGTDDYEVDLFFHEGKWDAECTCPVGFECKHAVAAMLALLNGVPAEATSPPVTSAVPSPDGATGNIEADLARALGRPLDGDERRFARRVRALFNQRRHRVISQWDIQELYPHQSTARWQTRADWISSLGTEVEFWNHLSHLSREAGLRVPEFMKPITDEEAARRHIQAWKREQEIDRWRQRLEWVGSRQRAATPSVAMDFRARIATRELLLECRAEGGEKYEPVKPTRFRQLADAQEQGTLMVVAGAHTLWLLFYQRYRSGYTARFMLGEVDADRLLHALLTNPDLHERVVNITGEPLARPAEILQWRAHSPTTAEGDYVVRLTMPDGSPVTRLLVALDGRPALYVTATSVFRGPPRLPRDQGDKIEAAIPAPALESREGVEFLLRLGAELPPKLREKVRTVAMRVRIRCEITHPSDRGDLEWMYCTVEAEGDATVQAERYTVGGWRPIYERKFTAPPKQRNGIDLLDRSLMDRTPQILAPLGLNWSNLDQSWRVRVTKQFPDKFAAWFEQVPPEVKVELVGPLADLGAPPIRTSVRLDCEASGMDWFDLKVVLDVTDTQLTPEEIKLLVAARGRYVRLPDKGWRRLQFTLTGEDEDRLARLGLNAMDFGPEPQRFHALQLADDAAAALLPAARAEAIKRRAREIQTRVAPPVPASVRAQLRPYQIEGFHFLAYLGANRFGGVLADDMGLGKTVQTLTWLTWLRDQAGAERKPCLVVCPKSVTDNWRTEAGKFAPDLTVTVWRGGAVNRLRDTVVGSDLLIVNYAQLRTLADALRDVAWRAVILDEGQYIKNPTSQTARAACSLKSEHRLVLTGTPIENRLLDLWSLMTFAMPGVLGNRAEFGRRYDHAADPLARRRLSARVRPFLLRRTKQQVAAELPDRVEEDLLCEMEGEQETLYRAELKHAQQMLLAIRTQQEFDRQRFHFLTSLLRLRQICCHPALVNDKLATGPSAKLNALIELLEPLMEEGHKVLVFSQFVTLLELLRAQMQPRGWRHFYLTGETENRGDLVERFQNTEGAAVFLVSLKAGGFGLNLTAASYVVLFDPWWNPAVENQAIDRTHRIGQTRHVNAYRLLIKNSIEEKIRALQRSKSALAQDILGEENFGGSLTLDDLKFLFADDSETSGRTESTEP